MVEYQQFSSQMASVFYKGQLTITSVACSVPALFNTDGLLDLREFELASAILQTQKSRCRQLA